MLISYEEAKELDDLKKENVELKKENQELKSKNEALEMWIDLYVKDNIKLKKAIEILKNVLNIQVELFSGFPMLKVLGDTPKLITYDEYKALKEV